MRPTPVFIGFALLVLTACTTEAQTSSTGTSGAEFKLSADSAASSTSSIAPPTVSGPVTERIQSGGMLQIGDPDARVSMLLFINHSSDYSRQFMRELLPKLTADFVSKGTLQIGIVPMEFTKYPQSQMTAGLMLCASTQGKGSAMNDLLFSEPNDATLQKQIGEMGLDLARLEACLKSDRLKQWIIDEYRLSQSFNITLVPSYTLNGAMFTGLPEYADLRGQIQTNINR